MVKILSTQKMFGSKKLKKNLRKLQKCQKFLDPKTFGFQKF
jgi:hypothetical protein